MALADDEVEKALFFKGQDVLGAPTTLQLQGTAPPGGGAAAALPAPSGVGGTSGFMGGARGNLAGPRISDGPGQGVSPSQVTELVKKLAGQPTADLGARGDTGGVSLSDIIRSGGVGLSPSELETVRGLFGPVGTGVGVQGPGVAEVGAQFGGSLADVLRSPFSTGPSALPYAGTAGAAGTEAAVAVPQALSGIDWSSLISAFGPGAVGAVVGAIPGLIAGATGADPRIQQAANVAGSLGGAATTGAVGGAMAGTGAAAGATAALLPVAWFAGPYLAAELIKTLTEVPEQERALSRTRVAQQKFQRGLPSMMQDISAAPGLLTQLEGATPEQASDIYNQLRTIGRNWAGGDAVARNAPSFEQIISKSGDIGPLANLPLETTRALQAQVGPSLAAYDLGLLRAQDIMQGAGMPTPEGGWVFTPESAALTFGRASYNLDPETGVRIPQTFINNPWVEANYQRRVDPAQLFQLGITDPNEAAAAGVALPSLTQWTPDATQALAAIQPGQLEAGLKGLFGPGMPSAQGNRFAGFNPYFYAAAPTGATPQQAQAAQIAQGALGPGAGAFDALLSDEQKRAMGLL